LKQLTRDLAFGLPLVIIPGANLLIIGWLEMNGNGKSALFQVVYYYLMLNLPNCLRVLRRDISEREITKKGW
jgi:hypothetical protein